ncbi:hypothetical protein [Actinacidiphila glaucinigra]|uniref:Uncharacterized protein n=1 Tax=Actinacidiphila glaucinigra TaxID=235986 RepID=A0A239D1I9_9ACTN|nr:hypothetical protein [Actinacidiphila glaucinigra]SNS26069.1 hypothetical protein SAMN05216252_104334 [Actinacidiphila glaucinigra]
MTRELYNVRLVPREGDPTPLTDEEEQRARATLFNDLGRAVSDRGWVRFPAYSPEERRRLVDVARRLGAYWGTEVGVEAEDHCSMRLFLPGYGPRETAVTPAVEGRN